MDFNKLSDYLQEIEETSSRTEMTKTLRDLLTELDPEEVQETLYLMTGRIAAKYVSLEFNLAEKMAQRAIAAAFDKKADKIKEIYKEVGDLGLTAEKLAKGGKEVPILDVFEELKRIAEYSGEGSQDKKIKGLANLISKLKPLGARYLVRIVLDELRLGIGDKTIIDALSWSQTKDKSLSKDIERAYAVTSDLGLVGETLLKDGIKEVKKFELTPGRPVAAKLAQREDTPKEIFERLGKCIIQPKLDGLRCQIHKWEEHNKKKVKLFTRNLEDITSMFPEIAEAAKKLPLKSVILDCEVIGYNPDTEEFIRFQKTMQRRRKYEIEEKAAEIPVYAFAFDILRLNGKDLTTKTYKDRLDELEKAVNEKKQAVIKRTETNIAKSEKEIKDLFDEYVSEGLEGLMAKSLDHKYTPGNRNYDWIKLKRAYESKLADTVDAVVLGYYKGRGKQAKLGIGAFLAAVYHKKKDRFETIAKVGTGVTEKQWREIKKRLDKIEADEPPARAEIPDSLIPDVPVKLEVVAVIEADEITESPTHSSGYALRFPRLVEFDRKDKSPDKATTLKEIKEMHHK